MKRLLKRNVSEIYYYNGSKKIIGIHSNITGNASGIRGDVSDIRGDVSGIRGDVNGITGNIDMCEITEEERKEGIKIEDLLEVTDTKATDKK